VPLPILRAAALICLLPLSAHAQDRHWVQVEAHPTLRSAEEMARRYEADFAMVAGFRLPSGWYALALGPYESAEDAAEVRRRLLIDRMIPRDAYLTQDRDYSQQFWPLGAQMPAAPSVAEEPGLRIVEIDPPRREERIEPPAAAVPEPSPEALSAERDAPAADVPEPAPEEPDEDRIVAPAPVLAAPVPEAPRDETLAESRAADARLTRAERAEIQTALQFFGHYTMAIDAAFGPGTRRAIEAWQAAQGEMATGFLTTRQRTALLEGHAEAVARLGLETWNDDQAGIEVTLPLGLVTYDRHESPFVHFEPANDSGMRVLLISQEGTQATLAGLYEAMQTLEAIPVEGERARRPGGFTITGESPSARAHAEATLQGGRIKGFALLWEPRADDDAARVLRRMQQTFRSIGEPLAGGEDGPASAVARQDLLSGLEVRRPLKARSGFSWMPSERWRRPPKRWRAAAGSPSTLPTKRGSAILTRQRASPS
jgi:peptidoglycan hydrolase-like protein with peptidoglycan-binding domain